MNEKDLAEAFDGSSSGDESEELDEDTEETADEAVSADADVFFDDTEDKATRFEALRRLVRKLKG